MAGTAVRLALILFIFTWRIAGTNGFWNLFGTESQGSHNANVTSTSQNVTTTTEAPHGFWNIFSSSGNNLENNQGGPSTTPGPTTTAGSWWPDLTHMLDNFNKAIADGMAAHPNSTSSNLTHPNETSLEHSMELGDRNSSRVSRNAAGNFSESETGPSSENSSLPLETLFSNSSDSNKSSSDKSSFSRNINIDTLNSTDQNSTEHSNNSTLVRQSRTGNATLIFESFGIENYTESESNRSSNSRKIERLSTTLNTTEPNTTEHGNSSSLTFESPAVENNHTIHWNNFDFNVTEKNNTEQNNQTSVASLSQSRTANETFSIFDNTTDSNRSSASRNIVLNSFGPNATESNRTGSGNVSDSETSERQSRTAKESEFSGLNTTENNGTQHGNGSDPESSVRQSRTVNESLVLETFTAENDTGTNRSSNAREIVWSSFNSSTTNHNITEHGTNSTEFETSIVESNETENRSSNSRNIDWGGPTFNATDNSTKHAGPSSNSTDLEGQSRMVNQTNTNSSDSFFESNDEDNGTDSTRSDNSRNIDLHNQTTTAGVTSNNNDSGNSSSSCPECSGTLFNETVEPEGNATNEKFETAQSNRTKSPRKYERNFTTNITGPQKVHYDHSSEEEDSEEDPGIIFHRRHFARTIESSSNSSNTSDSKVSGFSLDNKTVHLVFDESSANKSNIAENSTSNREDFSRAVNSSYTSNSTIDGFVLHNGSVFAVFDNGEVVEASPDVPEAAPSSPEKPGNESNGADVEEPEEQSSGNFSNPRSESPSHNEENPPIPENNVENAASNSSVVPNKTESNGDSSQPGDNEANVPNRSHNSGTAENSSTSISNGPRKTDNETNPSQNGSSSRETPANSGLNNTSASEGGVDGEPPSNSSGASSSTTSESQGSPSNESNPASNNSSPSSSRETPANSGLNNTGASEGGVDGEPPSNSSGVSSSTTSESQGSPSNESNPASNNSSPSSSGNRQARSFIPFSDDILKPFMVISNLNQTSTPPILLSLLQKEDLLKEFPSSTEITESQKEAFLNNAVYDIGASLDALSEKDKQLLKEKSALVEQLDSFPGKEKYVILPSNWWSKFVIDKRKPPPPEETTTAIPTTMPVPTTTTSTTTAIPTTTTTSTTPVPTTTTVIPSTTVATTTTTFTPTTTQSTTIEDCEESTTTTTTTTTTSPSTTPYYPPVQGPVYTYEYQPNYPPNQIYYVEKPTVTPVVVYPGDVIQSIFPYDQQVIPLENVGQGPKDQTVYFPSPEEVQRYNELAQGDQRGPAVFQSPPANDYAGVVYQPQEFPNPELGPSRGGYRQGKQIGLEYYEQVYAPPDLVIKQDEQQQIVLCPDSPALPCPGWMVLEQEADCQLGSPCQDPLLICCLVGCRPTCTAGIQVPRPQVETNS